MTSFPTASGTALIGALPAALRLMPRDAIDRRRTWRCSGGAGACIGRGAVARCLSRWGSLSCASRCVITTSSM